MKEPYPVLLDPNFDLATLQKKFDPKEAAVLLDEYRLLPAKNQTALEEWKARAVQAGYKPNLPETMAAQISNVANVDWEFTIPTPTF